MACELAPVPQGVGARRHGLGLQRLDLREGLGRQLVGDHAPQVVLEVDDVHDGERAAVARPHLEVAAVGRRVDRQGLAGRAGTTVARASSSPVSSRRTPRPARGRAPRRRRPPEARVARAGRPAPRPRRASRSRRRAPGRSRVSAVPAHRGRQARGLARARPRPRGPRPRRRGSPTWTRNRRAAAARRRHGDEGGAREPDAARLARPSAPTQTDDPGVGADRDPRRRRSGCPTRIDRARREPRRRSAPSDGGGRRRRAARPRRGTVPAARGQRQASPRRRRPGPRRGRPVSCRRLTTAAGPRCRRSDLHGDPRRARSRDGRGSKRLPSERVLRRPVEGGVPEDLSSCRLRACVPSRSTVNSMSTCPRKPISAGWGTIQFR